MRKIQYYNCNKWGHFAYECKSSIRDKGKSNNEEILVYDDGFDSNLVLLMVTTSDEVGNIASWYLGTGCSTRTTSRRNWFISLDESTKNKFRYVDDTTLKAEGIGKVLIKRKDGKQSLFQMYCMCQG